MNQPTETPKPLALSVPADVTAAMSGAAAFGGKDTVALAVGDVLGITDWFVITSASNVRQVRRIAEEVEKAVAAAGGPKPLHREGLDDAQWVLLDFGPFVVHVFHDETRLVYALERLWADVPTVAHVDERASAPAS